MTGSAHGGPADDNDVGGVFRVCVGVEESARSAPSTWGVFDEPLTDHDLLVLSRAFDFSDGSGSIACRPRGRPLIRHWIPGCASLYRIRPGPRPSLRRPSRVWVMPSPGGRWMARSIVFSPDGCNAALR